MKSTPIVLVVVGVLMSIATLNAGERTRVYVMASETAAGDPKAVADSVKDVQREIKRHRRLSLSESAVNAQVVVRVIGRETSLDNNSVRAEMVSGASKQDVSASARVGHAYSWTDCAERITKNVVAWLDNPRAFHAPPPPTNAQIAAVAEGKAATVERLKASVDSSTAGYVKCMFASADSHVKGPGTPGEIADAATSDCGIVFTVYQRAVKDLYWESGLDGAAANRIVADSREDFRLAVISRVLKARDPR